MQYSANIPEYFESKKVFPDQEEKQLHFYREGDTTIASTEKCMNCKDAEVSTAAASFAVYGCGIAQVRLQGSRRTREA